MKICYLNITASIPARDRVYLGGLKELGHEIVECKDNTPGFKKFSIIYNKVRNLKKDYDIIFVGYSAHILVPFAKIISRKRIIFNSLGSLYESKVDSHGYSPFSWIAVRAWIIDFLAFHCADLSLIDTDKEIEYLGNKFILSKTKMLQTWTGADSNFYYDSSVSKLPTFTALFRGAFVPECGIEYILDAAKLLENEPINFRIIGRGFLENIVEKKIKELGLKKVEWIKEWLPIEELRRKMQECHVSLGVAGNAGRLERTIYHKVFESLAMKIPYLTAHNQALKELLTDRETCLFFEPNNIQDIADKIKYAKNNPDKILFIAENGYTLRKRSLTPIELAKKLPLTKLAGL
jgi:glycosyltransferase involved in cell wall biosynthesis